MHLEVHPHSKKKVMHLEVHPNSEKKVNGLVQNYAAPVPVVVVKRNKFLQVCEREEGGNERTAGTRLKRILNCSD